MGRVLKVRTPRAAELRQLHQWVEEAEEPLQRRRAAMVVHYANGFSAQDIATALHMHPNTVYSLLHAFDRRGLAAIRESAQRGVPVRIAAAQATEICRVADLCPGDFGLPYGRWSLTTLRAYLCEKHIVRKISREHLRRLLKKRGSVFAASAGS